MRAGSEPLVLLVDDDPRIVKLRGSMLEDYGCEVITASSLSEARAMLEAAGSTLDLVVVDINLTGEPGDLSGVQLARAVRESHRDVPIVGYSGVVGPEEITEADTAPFERLVIKGRAFGQDLVEITAWMADRARKHRDAG
jgi:CheY-like chemotaxis protein